MSEAEGNRQTRRMIRARIDGMMAHFDVLPETYKEAYGQWARRELVGLLCGILLLEAGQ